MMIPAEIAINAWRRGAAQGPFADRADRWGSRGGLPPSMQPMDLGRPPDPADWRSDDVGYGVLLPENDRADDRAKAVGADAAEAVQELLGARPGTVMLRWREQLDGHRLRRYFPDGSYQEPRIGLSVFGTAKGRLPRFVSIIGGPEAIPWSVQYALETRHAVGRIPLQGDQLAHYVNALLNDFPAADVDVRAPLMWTVAHPGDITAEMRAVIADPLSVRLTDPQLPRFEHVTDDGATGAALLAKLQSATPGLLVTSSHGFAEGEADVLRAGLGLPVDVAHQPVGIDELVAAVPGGAIWYAQACCSAGSSAPSAYPGLLGPGLVLETVEAVAALGNTVAPAAMAVLGRESPARAVLGHVEPTFDWTLRDELTGQGLGGLIVEALSANLFAGQPVGYAFEHYRAGVGELHTQWAGLLDGLNAGNTSLRAALTRTRLTAIDRQSLVLLGDPTATLPPLAVAP
jgi:hypothetical protein